MAEYSLLRDAFALTLKLDEVSGEFVCRCKPPLNDVINADVQRAATLWLKLIANGWARRRNNGRHVDRKSVRVQCGGFKNGGTMRGTFVAPEMSEREVATANTKRQLMAKLRRNERLADSEVTLAVAFGLGEAYRSDNGEISLKPYGYGRPSWTASRGLSRKPTATSS